MDAQKNSSTGLMALLNSLLQQHNPRNEISFQEYTIKSWCSSSLGIIFSCLVYSKPIIPIHRPGLPYLLQFTVSCLGFEQQPPRLCLQQVRRIQQGNTVHFLRVTSTPFVCSLALSDLGWCRHLEKSRCAVIVASLLRANG